MNADGTEAHRLTTDARYRDESPHWTSDGRYILFLRMDNQNRTSLWSSLDVAPEQFEDSLTRSVVRQIQALGSGTRARGVVADFLSSQSVYP